MSKATLIPRKEAVTKTVTVTPEEPAKVVLEISLHHARMLRAMVGRCNHHSQGMGAIYESLDSVLGDTLRQEYKKVITRALQSSYSRGTIDLTPVIGTIHQLEAQTEKE